MGLFDAQPEFTCRHGQKFSPSELVNLTDIRRMHAFLSVATESWLQANFCVVPVARLGASTYFYREDVESVLYTLKGVLQSMQISQRAVVPYTVDWKE